MTELVTPGTFEEEGAMEDEVDEDAIDTETQDLQREEYTDPEISKKVQENTRKFVKEED